MRPLKVRAEGFSAYRAPVDVDFADVDFFSLSGPTGSGKSSLIDAMVFALFGRVPRLGARAVAPAISAGADRARVQLDFEVDSVVHTVVRLAERTKGGASIREARLERGDEVLADGADQVTEAVEELLHLRFEDFTKTVVLPQGEFARFLTAPKAERQTLLRNLLGLEVYSEMRALAHTRAAVAEERAALARATLQALDIPDEAQLAGARDRLKILDALSSQVARVEERIGALAEGVRVAATERERLEGAVGRLTAINAPERLNQMETLTAAARERVGELHTVHERRVAELELLREALGEIPSAEEIARIRMARDRLVSMDAVIAGLDLEGAAKTVAEAEKTYSQARGRLETATAELEMARRTHAAHALTATLVVGEPCPVCQHEVTEVPVVSTPELDLLELAVREETLAIEEARLALDAATTARVRLETTLGEQTTQRDQMLAQLEDAPSRDSLDETELRRQQVEIEMKTKSAEIDALVIDLKTAQRDLEDLTEGLRALDRTLVSAQLSVADLSPPLSDSDDVTVKWKDLLLWRDEAVARETAGLAAATVTLEKAEAELADTRRALEGELTTLGLSTTPPYSALVATEQERMRAKVSMFEKTLSDAAALRTNIEQAERTALVAEALSNHLKANGFERWLMAGAVADLVAGANGLLAELSLGGHSLHTDETGSFSIVDHRNADELRDVATLSGGETFLVSLALALSLAETLASAGGAKLDTIILDEGFGTLDEESLDTVATILEDLAGDGLMVGVITHVKELASRAPVRYEVTRLPTGSTVKVVT